MAHLDLDQEPAAKAEQDDEPHTITYSGATFTIPSRPPWVLMEDLGRFIALSQSKESLEQAQSIGALSEAMRDLLGDEQWAEFRALRPDQGTVFALVNGITKLYGLGDLGEVPGSDEKSRGTGGRRKLTSSASTGSTSDEPATAQTA